ncbi:DUF551 domain-containing protein [Aeromonas veronii]
MSSTKIEGWLEEKQTMEMKWISVKDELPKYGEPVLLCDWAGVVQKQTYYRDHDDVSDFWQDVGDNYDGAPLDIGDHWMPLPKPIPYVPSDRTY